ncbi:MAG: DUF58 domain-containing protein [Actinomycetes bacterium]
MSVQPTRRAALLMVLVAVALLAWPGGQVPVVASVAVLALAVVALVVADALVSTSPSRLVVERRHPPVVVAGTEAELTWTFRSEFGRTVEVALADQLAPSLRARARRCNVKVPPGGTARVTTTLRPLRRGRFELDHVTVRLTGRLGLGTRQVRVPLATVLRVHPPFRSREEAELKIRRARILELGIRTARGQGGGTEFEQLREYGPDDEFRRIDWTATARTGRTIVRTYRAERNQSVLVLLDNGRTMAGRVAGVPRVEHAMDAAMMLSHVATRLGDRCGLVAFDREVRATVPPGRHKDQVSRVTEAMFSLEPELAESDYTGAFAQVVARFRRRAMLVLLTDLVDQAVEDSLLPALPLITRTHLVVVGAVLDPPVVAWAAGEHGPDEDPDAVAYRRAAAVDALAARRRTVARLRGAGATVVDAAPGKLSSELADAYLLVKSTGRL